jgi:photosystem I subunit X
VLKYLTTGEDNLINSILLAALQQTVPDTPSWNWTISLVMSICIILGIIFARIAAQNRSQGSSLSSPAPTLGKSFGLPDILAGLSFGHILGVGTVLGLTNTGLL